ncbi:MAG TPA: hypothetical protein ENF93_02415, partial [Ignisphaera sp.]|nr:hypothetical protein [Ignisphaera sp.]
MKIKIILMRRVYSFELREYLDVPELPQRIVSLTPSLTEILIEMGMSKYLVGISSWCRTLIVYGYEELSSKPVVGNYKSVDEEKITRLSPDMILLAGGYQLRVIDSLKNLGIPFYVVTLPKNVSDIVKVPIEIGYAINKPDEGIRLSKKILKELSKIIDIVKEIPILILLNLGELTMPGFFSFITQVFMYAGFNVWNKNIEQPYIWGENAKNMLKKLSNRVAIVFEDSSLKPSLNNIITQLESIGVKFQGLIALPVMSLTSFSTAMIKRIPIIARYVINAYNSNTVEVLHIEQLR